MNLDFGAMLCFHDPFFFDVVILEPSNNPPWAFRNQNLFFSLGMPD
jgi:hypothetical protein